MNELVELGKNATNDNIPNYFIDPNHKCYQHRIDALKFMYKVKIFSKTAQNNKSRKAAAVRKCVSVSKNRKLDIVQNL